MESVLFLCNLLAYMPCNLWFRRVWCHISFKWTNLWLRAKIRWLLFSFLMTRILPFYFFQEKLLFKDLSDQISRKFGELLIPTLDNSLVKHECEVDS